MVGGWSKESFSGSKNLGARDGWTLKESGENSRNIFLLNGNTGGNFGFLCFHPIPNLIPNYPKPGNKLKKEMTVLSMSLFERLLRG